MKKILFAMFWAMLLVIGMAVPTLAQEAVPGENAFFSWAYLATYAGAVSATVFVVQFLKLPLDKVGHVPTRMVTYAVALVILLGAQIFTAQAFNLESIALAVLNAVLVAFAAMGLYERAVAYPEMEKNDAQLLAVGDLVAQAVKAGLALDEALVKEEVVEPDAEAEEVERMAEQLLGKGGE